MTALRPLVISLERFPGANRHAGPRQGGVFHFHIRRAARERYRFDKGLFSVSGNVILPDFRAARVFAQRMNEVRDAGKNPERAVRAGHINAMGLIDEIFHHVLRLYEESANPGVFSRALEYVEKESGKRNAHAVLTKFGQLYPPRDVDAGTKELKMFLAGKTGAKPHTEMVLEELILLYIANINPAFDPFKELFDDSELAKGSAYRTIITALEGFFRTQPAFGPDNQFIFDLLRAPILASPNSLEGQLEFMKRQWGLILSEKYRTKLLGAGDMLREEAKAGARAGGGRPPTVVPTYPDRGSGELDRPDLERFSADLEWMPRIVMLAKNTYVWLAQLSAKYARRISRLDEIPDEELDQLARWNISGLWLIGIWERSRASQRIKQMTGNPEAVASAYSIYDYVIAAELGGEDAFLNLRRRAWERGIRMAGDMVPNHVGLYSKWVVEHPGHFIQSEQSPFPNYRFTGVNLSDRPDVDIRIEDGYWSRRDAAVVFQRTDTRTGSVRYIYHGNDGTNMPWNDTAQLDFLKSEVREAVIRTILHVAEKFSIIRFDAAMTLTKQHFRRLWYPQPGSGGDIPSRADHAMSREEFERAFPEEFWREVVDRINAEMPQTLLLAEAFWLLEGYFVRTLGMHRVYNSAFMHMLMREENSKYRELIRNTLSYDPEILKRYVNFMSNPDEETAIAQFGRDDKYFGVAVMMVTLPGLPMLAHGQIEGFHEKYGMEYKRAYYDERPDADLIARHERELFPLMKKRRLFSHVEHFEMYDMADASGGVNENLFAYSNMDGDERALIVYHNKYDECSGWIRNSVPKVSSSGGEKRLVMKNLAEALALDPHEGMFYTFRDQNSGLEYIRSGSELRDHGMFLHLRAFQYQVFMDFKGAEDHSGTYAQLAESLQGRGVPDIRDAMTELRLRPVHEAFHDLIRADRRGEPGFSREEYARFLQSAAGFLGRGGEAGDLVESVHDDLATLAEIAVHAEGRRSGRHETARDPLRLVRLPGATELLLAWLSTRQLGRLISKTDIPRKSTEVFDTLRLASAIHAIAEDGGASTGGKIGVELIRLLILYQDVFTPGSSPETRVRVLEMLEDERVRGVLHVHRYREELYYNKEAFEELAQWLFIAGQFNRPPVHGKTGARGRVAARPGGKSPDGGKARTHRQAHPDEVKQTRTAAVQDTTHLVSILTLSDTSGYRLEELRRLLSESEPAAKEESTHA